MPSAQPLPSECVSTVDNVPTRLIETAIALYGARGTQAVSTREIQRKAEVPNAAAVRYYFGGKLGLLDNCLAHLARVYAPITAAAWRELDDIRQDRELDVRDVIAALVSSIYALHMDNPTGVQLLARMIREEGEAGQDLLLKHFGGLMFRLEDTLHELLPDKAADALRLHAFLALNCTINGVVDQALLWRLPTVEGGDGRFQMSGNKLAQGFVDYIAGGVSAAAEAAQPRPSRP